MPAMFKATSQIQLLNLTQARGNRNLQITVLVLEKIDFKRCYSSYRYAFTVDIPVES